MSLTKLFTPFLVLTVRRFTV